MENIIFLREAAVLFGGFVAAWLWLRFGLNLYPAKKYSARDNSGVLRMERGTGWSERPHKLADAANYLIDSTCASRLLIIRATDDEASLALAAGSLASRLSYLAMTKLSLFSLVVVPVGLGLVAAALPLFGARAGGSPGYLSDKIMPTIIGIGLLLSLFGALLAGVFKGFFGRELLVGCMRCEIAANSVPDVSYNAVAITLPSYAPAALEIASLHL